MTGTAVLRGNAVRNTSAELRAEALRRGMDFGGAARDEERSRKVVRRRTRLTLRGRIVVAIMIGIAAWAGWSAVAPKPAQSAPGVTQVVNYTVRPGDTLWSYASSITAQGDDVSATVNELMKLNNLDSASLKPGQRIIVPVQ